MTQEVTKWQWDEVAIKEKNVWCEYDCLDWLSVHCYKAKETEWKENC